MSERATVWGNRKVGEPEDAAKERGVVAFSGEGSLMGAAAAGEDETRWQ